MWRSARDYTRTGFFDFSSYGVGHGPASRFARHMGWKRVLSFRGNHSDFMFLFKSEGVQSKRWSMTSDCMVHNRVCGSVCFHAAIYAKLVLQP